MRKNAPDALFDLELKAYPGEHTCILGGNGSGKTTALCAAAGLRRIYDGKIKILGKNIERLGPESETSMDNWYSWGARYGVKFYKVEAGNTHFSNDNKGVLYNSTKTTLIAYPPASTETTFEIPSSVITVRHYAFDNISNLKTVTGGVNVESIGSVIRGSITRFP
ncbi:MAG: ATP-binding cassette domain-containing protein, partial [Clostridia bacterium]|nr:ATP-binding cassette domain-containing protein [Clostridia bacterium]